MNFLSRLTTLNLAKLKVREANLAAQQLGVDATRPLTPVRFKQLCELGEIMVDADRVLAAAERAYALYSGSDRVDIVLP